MPKRAISGAKLVGVLRFGAKMGYFRDQSCGVAAVWCTKGPFHATKLWERHGLAHKRAISRTKVGAPLWFGAKMGCFRDQTCGGAVVWCQNGVFPGPKLWGAVVCDAERTFSGP